MNAQKRFDEVRQFHNLYNKFIRTNSFLYYQFIHSRRREIYILTSNFRQFKTALRQHNQIFLPQFIENFNRANALWRSQRELVRVLANYLGSLKNQIDYSRKAINNFKLTVENEKLFQERLQKSFIENVRHSFIIDMRNYLIHCGAVKFVSEHLITNSPKKIEFKVYLSKQELLNSHVWSSKGKHFLNKLPEKIYLVDILEEHFREFKEFQDYCFLSIIDSHKIGILQLRHELNSLYKKCEDINCSGMLPFNSAYLKYCEYLVANSLKRHNR